MEAYPLQWPEYQNRTSGYSRKKSNFGVRFSKARDEAIREINLLGGKNIVVSSNLETRQDGLPYANAKEPSDPGVAIYFQLKEKAMVFACDKWKTTTENIRAIGKTIEAIRGIERWGSSEMMEQAFQGFKALPAPKKLSWRLVMGFNHHSVPSKDELRKAFRDKAMLEHPDHGGDNEKWKKVQFAYEQAKAELGI